MWCKYQKNWIRQSRDEENNVLCRHSRCKDVPTATIHAPMTWNEGRCKDMNNLI
ncbi:hypothetical protein Syun_012439 [Stephania yunnanensis]|uniref:Uncharacterized protein n=1 Tax=Stephania yunnanensis TaxID=152371 RepID=A0AAP0K084_9MAGN